MKRIITTAVALLAASAMSLTAFAERTPNPDGQNKDKWCWAAAAKMVAKHNSGLDISTNPQNLDNADGLHSYNGIKYWGEDENGDPTADGAQQSIVVNIKGDDKNDGANIDNDHYEIKEALRYASYGYVDVGKVGNPNIELDDAKINWLKQEMQCREYVIGGVRLQYVNQYHAVVITDYNASDNTYRVFDPMDMTDEYYPAQRLFKSFGFRVDDVYWGKIEWLFYSHNTN